MSYPFGSVYQRRCAVDDTSVVIVWLRCERGAAAAATTRSHKEAAVRRQVRGGGWLGGRKGRATER
jgi:hypothetical protein